LLFLSEVPTDFTITVHLFQLVIVESFDDLVNIGVVRKFIATDNVDFGIKRIEVIFGAVVTGIAAISEQLLVEHEAGFKGFGQEVVFHHKYSIHQKRPNRKGENRTRKVGLPNLAVGVAAGRRAKEGGNRSQSRSDNRAQNVKNWCSYGEGASARWPPPHLQKNRK
jgi:hypothetical protein